MEAVKVRIFENGLIGLLNREDFNPEKHSLIEDDAAEAVQASSEEVKPDEGEALPRGRGKGRR